VCPRCGYQAELPQSEMIFRCPIGDCCYESCRKCGGEPHIPLRCEEVEQKHQLAGRHHVEESISEAKIRRCPKPGCGKKFIKESGCNKIRCACGTMICYLCRKQIESYHHFCQVHRCNHKTCQKCPLHTNDEDVDEVAMRAAGIRAAEDIRKKSESEHGTAFDGIVDIDVEAILRKPK
jgi:E3 ubiquitin-protein ligase RNF216